jgi:hypothetical protein
MRRAGAALLGLALLAALGACAGGDRPSGPVTPIRVENLFMSPSGEPFRGGPDAPYAVAAWFAQADANHDGVLTRAEFLADADRAFARFDANHDGVIDGLELQAYESDIAPEILPRIAALRAGEGMDDSLFGGRRGGGRAGRGREGAQQGGGRRPRAGDRAGQGAGFYGLLDEPEPVSAADADLDGKVTLAEWRARSDRRFDLIAGDAPTMTLATLPKTAMQTLWERKKAREAAGKGERPRGPRPQ